VCFNTTVTFELAVEGAGLDCLLSLTSQEAGEDSLGM